MKSKGEDLERLRLLEQEIQGKNEELDKLIDDEKFCGIGFVSFKTE